MEATGEAQSIPINVYEADAALVVVAALPAVMPDDVEVSIEPGRLRIDAEMRTAAPKDYVVQEWTYGPYTRSYACPTASAQGSRRR